MRINRKLSVDLAFHSKARKHSANKPPEPRGGKMLTVADQGPIFG